MYLKDVKKGAIVQGSPADSVGAGQVEEAMKAYDGWVVIKGEVIYSWSLSANRNDAIQAFMDQIVGKDDRPGIGKWVCRERWINYYRRGFRCARATWSLI